MRNLLALFLAFQCCAFASLAQESGLFGINNSELAQIFLEEAEDIILSNQLTREISEKDVRELREFELLQEAYRTDPEATLDLIERILRAGGAT